MADVTSTGEGTAKLEPMYTVGKNDNDAQIKK